MKTRVHVQVNLTNMRHNFITFTTQCKVTMCLSTPSKDEYNQQRRPNLVIGRGTNGLRVILTVLALVSCRLVFSIQRVFDRRRNNFYIVLNSTHPVERTVSRHTRYTITVIVTVSRSSARQDTNTTRHNLHMKRRPCQTIQSISVSTTRNPGRKIIKDSLLRTTSLLNINLNKGIPSNEHQHKKNRSILLSVIPGPCTARQLGHFEFRNALLPGSPECTEPTYHKRNRDPACSPCSLTIRNGLPRASSNRAGRRCSRSVSQEVPI